MKLTLHHEEIFQAIKEYIERRGFNLTSPDGTSGLSLHTTVEEGKRLFWAESKIEVPPPKDGPYR